MLWIELLGLYTSFTDFPSVRHLSSPLTHFVWYSQHQHAGRSTNQHEGTIRNTAAKPESNQDSNLQRIESKTVLIAD